MVGRPQPPDMEVAVEVVGEGTRRVEVDPGAPVAALVDSLPASIHEVSVLVDGRPVPADRPIGEDLERVRVVRLVEGG